MLSHERKLGALHRTLNARGRYRHVLLTERAPGVAERAALRACATPGVELVFVNVTLPGRPADLVVPQRPHCAQFGDGYRRMCRFLARDIMLHPALAGAEYVARVDDDSHFWPPPNGSAPPPPHDVFERMRAERADYGYRLLGSDWCQEQLAPLTRAYAQEWNLHLAWRDGADLDKQMVFYNNFFVVRRALFADPRYANYIHYLDALGGVWSRRWGDHAIQTAAAALLDWRVARITDFGYRHQAATVDPGSFMERPTPGYRPGQD